MKSPIVAFFLLMSAFAAAQAPQQREADSPSLQETADYISIHSTHCNRISWQGTSVTFSCPTGSEFSLDAMNVDYAGPLPEADQIWLNCRAGIKCVAVDFKSDREDLLGGITLHAENAAIRDNVVRALNHFIRLLKQQNTPANDPFGPK